LKKLQGSATHEELAECFNNFTFQITGLCPDHVPTLEKANKAKHYENIKHSIPNVEQIIGAETNDLTFEMHDQVQYVVVYTDGSLYDAQSDTFCRAGWGVYVADDHPANAKGPLHTRNPTTFRAELKAVHHVLQHTAFDVLIRCDCKGAVTLVNRIIEEQSYDSKHKDADLLEAIYNICQTVQYKRKIEWMPAHLDNPKNAKNREKSWRRVEHSR
jgi:ribonuclease HI